MSYLTIDGAVVRVKSGSTKVSRTHIGSKERAFSGLLRRDERAVKRTWTLQTAPLSPELYRSMVALIQRTDFDAWLFDYDLVSKGGIEPTGTPAASIINGGSDQAALGSEMVKHGIGCLEAYPARASGNANLLAAACRDAEGTPSSDYTAIDSATLSASTTVFWQGAQSVKVVCSATVNGVRGGVYAQTDFGTAVYAVGSVWVRGTTGSVRAYLQSLGGSSAAVSADLSDGLWHRIDVGGVAMTDGSGEDAWVRLCVEELTADSGITFYCDGFSLATSDTLKSWTSWGDANTAAIDLAYDGAEVFESADDVTIAAWVKFRTMDSSTALHAAFSHYVDASNLLYVIYTPNSDTLDFVAKAGGITASVSETVTSLSGDWHHVAMVLRSSPPAGRTALECYLDGVLVGSTTPASWAGLGTLVDGGTFRIGDYGASQEACADIDSVFVAQSAIAAEVMAVLGSDFDPGYGTHHVIGGDLVDGVTLNASVTIKSETPVVARDQSTGLRAVFRQLELEIEEL